MISWNGASFATPSVQLLTFLNKPQSWHVSQQWKGWLSGFGGGKPARKRRRNHHSGLRALHLVLHADVGSCSWCFSRVVTYWGNTLSQCAFRNDVFIRNWTLGQPLLANV